MRNLTFLGFLSDPLVPTFFFVGTRRLPHFGHTKIFSAPWGGRFDFIITQDVLLLGLAVSTGVSLPLLHDASGRGHGEGQSRGALGEFLAFRGSGLGGF